MTDTYTTIHLRTQPDGSVVADFETNDNNDDGYDDGEITRFELTYRSMADVPSGMTYSHRGYYGQPVTVYLDGEEQFAPHPDAR